MNRPRILARVATPMAALLGALALAGPAVAHVEVEPATAQALTVGAVVGFNAEGESNTAGISQIRVVLPTGIAPGDVTLADGPQGWSLTPATDGYTVAGSALAPGRSAAYKVRIRQLPDAKELVFKSLVTYTDGHIDRWIELPQGGAAPEHPAPVLKLTAAAPGATPLAAGPSAASSPSASGSVGPTPSAIPSATPSTAAKASADASSSGNGPVIIGVVVVLLATVGGVVWWRRRPSAD